MNTLNGKSSYDTQEAVLPCTNEIVCAIELQIREIERSFDTIEHTMRGPSPAVQRNEYDECKIPKQESLTERLYESLNRLNQINNRAEQLRYTI